jgi:hypothetical protein
LGSETNLDKIKIKDAYEDEHLHKFMSGEITFSEDIVRFYGFNGGERYWGKYPEVIECISQLTGCRGGKLPDSLCMHKYALHQLVRGPIASHPDIDKLQGAKNDMVEKLLYMRYEEAPLIDVGVHLRLQFLGFEKANIVDRKSYDLEVQEFMNSDLRVRIFNSITTKLYELLNMKNISDGELHSVFLAADNAYVKRELYRYIQESNVTATLPINIIQLNTDYIHHGVFIVSNSTTYSSHPGLFSLSLDWYMLSLSRDLLSWRKGDEGSTYRMSARLMAGLPSYSLRNTKYGNPHWTLDSP